VEEHRLAVWESLFRKALQIIDSVDADILPSDRWSFGGGTVLMRRYRHRFSKDIDLFVPDPQYLGHLSPRLNDTVEAMTTQYIEQANFIKFYFPEGEIDVVAAGALTEPSSKMETILGAPGASRNISRDSRQKDLSSSQGVHRSRSVRLCAHRRERAERAFQHI
jgi:hypothetical protein